MKSNLRTAVAVIVAAVLLCTAALMLSACREIPTVMIDPVDDVSTTATYVTRTTVPTPDGQVTILDLMSIHDTEIPWSKLESFNHTMIDEDTARLAVWDTYGKECTLDVTIDFDTGMLTEADLYFGDVHTSILDESGTCFMPVLYALNGKTVEE